MATPEGAAVLRQLERVLGSHLFSHARVQAAFLREIVTRTVAGDTDGLKEQCLGATLFHRAPNYDAGRDSIVRTTASGLRDRLEKYYAGPGAADELLIILPRGGYVPAFSFRPPARRIRYPQLWIATLLGMAGLTVAAWYRKDESYLTFPSVARLTNEVGFTGHPVISRDGRLLAYASDREGSGELDIWVQRVWQGGSAVRLTTAPERDTSPDFSPDGEEVVFRSWRNGGGIWIVATQGGAERQLTTRGYSPRFRPTGTHVAFVDNGIYVVPRNGGDPIRLDHGVSNARDPVWSPDGDHVLFLGDGSDGSWDWWIAPVRSTAAAPLTASRPLGVRAFWARERNPEPAVSPSDWRGQDVIFTATSAIHTLRIRDDYRVGGLRTLLSGSAMVSARFGGEQDRSLVYDVRSSYREIATLPEDGRAEPRPVSADTNIHITKFRTLTSLSADGKSVAWASWASGIRLRRLNAESDLLVTGDAGGDDRPLLNPAGTRAVFQRRPNGAIPERGDLFLADVGTKASRRICRDCGLPMAWSPDERWVLWSGQKRLMALDPDTGKNTDIAANLREKEFDVFAAAFSPDGRWLALTAFEDGESDVKGYVIPFSVPLPDRTLWRPITKEPFHLYLCWAARGNALYSLQVRDGFRDIWRWSLNSTTKTPVGPPSPVYHFHRHRRYPNAGSVLSSGGGRLAVMLESELANVWLAWAPNR